MDFVSPIFVFDQISLPRSFIHKAFGGKKGWLVLQFAQSFSKIRIQHPTI